MEIEKSPFQRQVDDLMVKEKQARMLNDAPESAKILKQIVQLAYDLKEYKELFELIKALAKKRGQSKKAQVEMVQLAIPWIKEFNDINLKLDLINALKDVCDKKIYLEVEYARCCLMIVKLKEDDQQINEAAKILQEVQVETYGSMDKREKLEFILYQMKIMIKKKDYVRLIIISRKINPKNLEEKSILDLKILYYSYLVEYYNHEENTLDCAKSYLNIFETLYKNPELQKITTIDFQFNIEFLNILENYIMYLAISKQDLNQKNLLNNLKTSYTNALEKYPYLLNLIDNILKQEIISTEINYYKVSHVRLFQQQVEHHQNHLNQFKKYLIQHNILVIQKYYKKISLSRLASLLKINLLEAEDELCEMINDKQVFCKIDRVAGVVNFVLKRSENEILNEWSFDINKVLLLVDNTCNLIKREQEINAV